VKTLGYLNGNAASSRLLEGLSIDHACAGINSVADVAKHMKKVKDDELKRRLVAFVKTYLQECLDEVD
jgi:hypothetical protein